MGFTSTCEIITSSTYTLCRIGHSDAPVWPPSPIKIPGFSIRTTAAPWDAYPQTRVLVVLAADVPLPGRVDPWLPTLRYATSFPATFSQHCWRRAMIPQGMTYLSDEEKGGTRDHWL